METQGEIRRNQIDRYVNEEMEGEERLQFEQRMRDHVELAENVHMHRDVQRGIEYFFLKELKEELIKSDQEKPKNRLRTFLAIAASVLVMAGLATTYFLFNNSGHGSERDLFTVYFEPYPNVIAPVSRSSDTVDEKALQLYEMGKYEEAIAELTALIKENPERHGLVFYRGIAYLGINQPKEAAADFKNVITAEAQAFEEVSRWYLGLSELKMGKAAEARDTFEQVKNSGGIMAPQADQILEEIG